MNKKRGLTNEKQKHSYYTNNNIYNYSFLLFCRYRIFYRSCCYISKMIKNNKFNI